MATKTDGETSASGNPLIRTFREDAAITIMGGLLANPATTGTDTQIGPSVVFMAVSLADQLAAELSKEPRS
jgi:hypothetical protein